MARKSKTQTAAAATKSSTKRHTPPPTTSALAKRPKRQSVSKAAATKSDYFSHGSSQSEEEDDEESAVESPGVASSELDSSPDDEVEVESDISAQDEEDIDEKPKRSRGSASVKKKSDSKFGGKAAKSGKSELWRPGVSTGMESGTQVIIKKPKARDAGDTPYTDDTIHPNTLLFLKDLAANNDRGWLKMHDPDYRTSQKDFNSFLEVLTQNVVEADDTVPELPVKDIVMRIYRDIRFSKNPTPYKDHFSAAWSRTGRKGPYAVYYLQIKPNGGSCVAGGLWMPEANAVALLRRDIDRRPQRIKAVLKNAGIRKEFLEGVANDDAKVVKKFVAQSSQSALKTKPKQAAVLLDQADFYDQGFDAEHRDIDLLRLKSFTLSRKLEDSEVLGKRGLTRISELITTLVPFITYLNSVVMPDDEDEDELDDDEEEEGSVEVDN